MKRAPRFAEASFSKEMTGTDSYEIRAFQFMKKFNNNSVTENGAIGFHTTTRPLLDLNFMVSSLRNRSEEFIQQAFVRAYYDSPKYAVKWLFFLRDIEKGLGERRTFRICLKYLAFSHPDIATAVMELTPKYGRYDDLLVFLDTPLCRTVCSLLKKQLNKDLEAMQSGKPVSLLAKWLPGNNTSSKESRRHAAILTRFFHMTDRQYRKSLSSLRSYLDVCEVKMSASRWSELDYDKIPAKANLKYENAFERHDFNGRVEYLKKTYLEKDTLHTKGIMPHEILHRIMGPGLYCSCKNDLLAELMWQKIIAEGFENNFGLDDCIVVADGSGSMFCPVSGEKGVMAIEVCNALAIYFAEQLQGIFHNKAITFSMRPQFIDLEKGRSLKEKLEIMLSHNECANTNIEAVFDLLLQMAVSKQVPSKEIPKQVLILSDMEFDCAAGSPDQNLFARISEKYAAAGYQIPRLIFWNLCGRSDTIPMVENGNGLCLLSGFSQNAIQIANSKKSCDPYANLIRVLNSPRYDDIENAIKEFYKH